MERQSRPLLDLLLSIVLPSIVLMRFSGEQDLGASGALVVALAFPLGLGVYELLRYRQTNYIAVLGLVSVLGIAVLVSARLGYPLIRVMLYNPKILDTAKISRLLRERGVEQAFELRLSNATYLLAGTFFFSAVMNFLLATWIVTSPSGTAAFNEELGRLTLLSYPAIAIPSMLMMLGIFWSLWRSIRAYTGLGLEEILASPPADRQ